MPRSTPPNPPSLPGRPRLTWLVPLWARRHRHLTVPLLAVPAGATLAAAVVLAEHWRLPVLLTGAAVLACVWFFAPHKWDRTAEQVYAVGSVLAGAGWLTAVAYHGLSEPVWIAGGVLALAWGIPWWLHKRKRLHSSSVRLVRSWNAWWQHHCPAWHGEGSGVIDVEPRRDVEVLRVQLDAGKQHGQQFLDAIPQIEAALRGYVKHGMIRGHVDPDNPSVVVYHLRRENPLRDDIEWDQALAPASISEPAPIGKTESGDWVKVCLLVNWFILGRTRGGKSNELSAFLATITGCADARPWLIDMKGGRATRPWMAALDWVATTIDEARLMLTVALAEVQQRATYAYDGSEQLRPTREVPALFIIIDETHEVTSMARGDTQCANLLAAIASMGSGVAVYVIVLTQHGALSESVRTEQTRGNLEHRICFAVNDDRHGQFALSDWAKLNPSRLNVKGSFYYQLGSEAASEAARGPHMPHELVREIAGRHSTLSRTPLVLYANDHQEAYDMRWHRLPQAFRSAAPQCAGLDQAPAPPPVPAAPSPAAPSPASQSAVEMAAQVEADIAETPDVPLSALARIPTDFELASEMERRKAAFARLVTTAPEDGRTPSDLAKDSGMSRSWVQAQLSALVSAGSVTAVSKGRYRAAPGEDVWTALEVIREANSRLLASAGRP